MKIYLTRHSKTLWNQEKRLQGWQDSALTNEGIQDAYLLKDLIKNLKIDYCFSSPLSRALKTSEILFDQVIVDERLKEMNFGDYEGKYLEQLKDDSLYFKLWHHPEDDFKLPNGESYHEVQLRLLDFFKELYQQHHEDTVFITIHGMLFIILQGLMQGYKTTELVKINGTVVRGCSLSEVEYDGNNFIIKYIGDERHLKHQETITYK